jgi:hypothetical protein
MGWGWVGGGGGVVAHRQCAWVTWRPLARSAASPGAVPAAAPLGKPAPPAQLVQRQGRPATWHVRPPCRSANDRGDGEVGEEGVSARMASRWHPAQRATHNAAAVARSAAMRSRAAVRAARRQLFRSTRDSAASGPGLASRAGVDGVAASLADGARGGVAGGCADVAAAATCCVRAATCACVATKCATRDGREASGKRGGGGEDVKQRSGCIYPTHLQLHDLLRSLRGLQLRHLLVHGGSLRLQTSHLRLLLRCCRRSVRGGQLGGRFGHARLCGSRLQR